MTHQSPAQHMPLHAEAGHQVAQLRNVLLLVEQIAGGTGASGRGDAALDGSARLSSAYDQALAVRQRRFDALAAETAAWAAEGVEALLAAPRPPRAAAARLAAELERALADLGRLVRL